MNKRVVAIIIFLLGTMAIASAQNQEKGTVSNAGKESIASQEGFGYMNNLDSLLREANQKQDSLFKARVIAKNRESSDNSLMGKFFGNADTRIIFWIALALFFVFITYKFGSTVAGLPRKFQSENKSEPAELDVLKTPTEYDEEVLLAENAGNFNLAVRFLFLKTLSLLNTNGQIEFLPERTNQEYLDTLKDTLLKKKFSRLIRIYEYAWYGDYALKTGQYQEAKELFNQLHK